MRLTGNRRCSGCRHIGDCVARGLKVKNERLQSNMDFLELFSWEPPPTNTHTDTYTPNQPPQVWVKECFSWKRGWRVVAAFTSSSTLSTISECICLHVDMSLLSTWTPTALHAHKHTQITASQFHCTLCDVKLRTTAVWHGQHAVNKSTLFLTWYEYDDIYGEYYIQYNN